MDKNDNIKKERICRVCAKTNLHLLSLEKTYDNVSFAEIIEDLFPVVIEKSSDKFPKLICHQCKSVVVRAYKLGKICVENDQMFRKQLNSPMKQDSVISKGKSNERSEKRERIRSEDIIELMDQTSAKKPKYDSNEDFFSQVGEFLPNEVVIEIEDDKPVPEPEQLPQKENAQYVKISYKCNMNNCKITFSNSDMLSIHKMLHHSDVLRQPSKHPKVDIIIKHSNDLVERPFGLIYSKDGREMRNVPSNLRFCKLCINVFGTIRGLANDKHTFFQHVLGHFQSNNLEKSSSTVDLIP